MLHVKLAGLVWCEVGTVPCRQCQGSHSPWVVLPMYGTIGSIPTDCPWEPEAHFIQTVVNHSLPSLGEHTMTGTMDMWKWGPYGHW